MPIPPPEAGLVICYSYVWDREARVGQEEGGKNRPCVVVLAVQRGPGAEIDVTVLPVTHRPPDNPAAGVEIPQAVKRHLGLDDDRSWVIVSEGDRFVWPGYDLRQIPGSDRYAFGFLPPRFFESIVTAFRAWHRAHKVKLVPRD